MHIFLSGHGGWKPSSGYTQLPARCHLHFYTHFAKLLQTVMEVKILSGAWKATERSHGPFSAVPNMTLYGQPKAWTRRAEKNLSKAAWGSTAEVLALPDEDDEATLAQLFEEIAGADVPPEDVHFHWMCCSHVDLKPSGGADVGVNATDFADNLSYQGNSGRYRNENRRGTYKPILGELKRLMR